MMAWPVLIAKIPLIVMEAKASYDLWHSLILMPLKEKFFRFIHWSAHHDTHLHLSQLGGAVFGCMYAIVIRPLQADAVVIEVALTVPLMLQLHTLMERLVMPFDNIGLFHSFVFCMLKTDVLVFLIIFLIFLVNYGLTMYLTAPAWVMGSVTADGRWKEAAAFQELISLGLFSTELAVKFDDLEMGPYVLPNADMSA